MRDMLMNKLSELESVTDTIYRIKYGHNDPVPIVHWFEMRKSGNGWCTKAYFSMNGTVECPLGRDIEEDIFRRDDYSTLRKIKNQFDEHDFHCVVEGHLTAPTTIYQLVVENVTVAMKEDIINYAKNNGNGSGLTHDFHVNIKWVSDIPKDIYREWIAY